MTLDPSPPDRAAPILAGIRRLEAAALAAHQAAEETRTPTLREQLWAHIAALSDDPLPSATDDPQEPNP